MAVLGQGDVNAARSTAISFGRTAASGIGASSELAVKDWTGVGNFEVIQSNSRRSGPRDGVLVKNIDYSHDL